MIKHLRILFTLVFATLALSVSAQSQMHLELADGSSVVYVLSTNPKLTFADSKLTVSVAQENTSFEMANVKKFYFEAVGTAIKTAASASDVCVRYLDGRNLEITTSAGGVLSLYDVQGKLLQQKALGEGTTTLSVGKLVPGSYILKVGDISMKLAVK